MNEVSKKPLRRSTIPFDSGSRGGSRSSVVANVPVNPATPSACRLPRPMPASLSQISRRGTRPSSRSSSQVANSRSSVRLVGIIRPSMKREKAAVITSTGNNTRVPFSSGILRGGNHRSHCPASPAAQDSRSAGSGLRYSGRSRRTLSRNHVIDPVQPTRSAITVAGRSGCSASSARTRGSNAVNDVGTGLRSYFGGRSDRVPAQPSTDRSPSHAPPDAASPRPPPAGGSTPNPPLRSPTQSVWVASFSSVAMASFSSVVDRLASATTGRSLSCLPLWLRALVSVRRTADRLYLRVPAPRALGVIGCASRVAALADSRVCVGTSDHV